MDLGAVTFADAFAVAVFAAAWIGYAAFVDHGPLSGRTLSSAMDRQRRVWVRAMQSREVRIADTNVLGGLQQGTAFFASASMLGIGACLALLGSGDRVANAIADITSSGTQGAPFDLKIVGLTVIFVYAFFKFTWGYRLFNYASILMGALPPAAATATSDTELAIDRTALFLRLGGRNFNRGQRAFLFSIAYLGWLAGPWLLVPASAFVLLILVHRQFWSQPARLMRSPTPPPVASA